MQRGTFFLAWCAILVCLGTSVSWAGSLEPKEKPGSTMKTLDEIEPRRPLSQGDFPVTISQPGSYYLTENVSYKLTSGAAVMIACDDVVLDLMGHTLSGSDFTTVNGIAGQGRTNVEVRNGTIRDFNDGIYETAAGSRWHIINVSVLSNRHRGINLSGRGNTVSGCTAVSNGNSGIYTGPGSTIRDCTADQNVYCGINGKTSCSVTGCSVYANGQIGIYLDEDGGLVSNCVGYSNGTAGIFAVGGATITGNTCYDNGIWGIQGGMGSTITDNTCYGNASHGIFGNRGCLVSRNTVRGNRRNGIYVEHDCTVLNNHASDNDDEDTDGFGIRANSNNRIEGNHVTGSARGIVAFGSGNLVVRNSARANPVPYDIAGSNTVGAITSNPITAGPWDNFSF